MRASRLVMNHVTLMSTGCDSSTICSGRTSALPSNVILRNRVRERRIVSSGPATKNNRFLSYQAVFRISHDEVLAAVSRYDASASLRLLKVGTAKLLERPGMSFTRSLLFFFWRGSAQ